MFNPGCCFFPPLPFLCALKGECSTSAFLPGRRAGSFIAAALIIVGALPKSVCTSYGVIWALRACLRPCASRFSRRCLSSAHDHLFRPYSLEALLRLVFPFLALAAEMPGTLSVSFLREERCLLLFAAPRLVERLVRNGGTPYKHLGSCASPSLRFWTPLGSFYAAARCCAL